MQVAVSFAPLVFVIAIILMAWTIKLATTG